jgi:hypothetical protein
LSGLALAFGVATTPAYTQFDGLAARAVLPGAAWRDVCGLGPHGRDPILQGFSDELRAIVGTDVAGHTTQDEEVGENIDDVDGLEFAIDADRQAPRV